MIQHLVPSLGFALLAMASTVSAGVVVTTAATAPDQNVFATIAPSAASNTQWRNTNTSRRDLGQTFYVAHDTALKSVTFRLALVGEGAPGANVTLNIYRFADKDSFTPLGPALHTASGVLPETLTVDTFLTFTLDDAANLTNGNYYGIVLTFPDQIYRQQLSFYSGNPSTAGADYGNTVYYEGLHTDSAYAWVDGVNALAMYATAVPEPSLAGLLILGAPLVILGRAAYTKHRNR